jgi:hypothetical protein
MPPFCILKLYMMNGPFVKMGTRANKPVEATGCRRLTADVRRYSEVIPHKEAETR